MENQERRSGVGMIIFIVILLLILLFIGYRYFRVSKIEIEGNVNIDEAYIARLTGIVIDQNLFTVKAEKVKFYINSDPYLEYYDIKRIYPSTIKVEVYERIPAALIIGQNSNYVVDNEANVLDVIDGVNHTMMIVEGLTGFVAKPGQYLATKTPYQFDALVSILKDVKFNELNELVTVIDMSDINKITMQTQVGFTVVFGQADKVSDKIVWISTTIDELVGKNITSGTVNVISGNFATYSE